MEVFDEIEKLVALKEQEISDDEEKEMLDFVKEMLDNKITFFEIDMKSVMSILYFLGVKKENLKSMYFKIISAENYREFFPVQRHIVDNNEYNIK